MGTRKETAWVLAVSGRGPPTAGVATVHSEKLGARSKMAGGGGPQASAFSLILLVDDQGPLRRVADLVEPCRRVGVWLGNFCHEGKKRYVPPG